jgi:hypothetical protein
MKTCGGMAIQIHVFLTSALVGGEWSASRLRRFTPGERAPGTHWIGSWVGPRTGLGVVIFSISRNISVDKSVIKPIE